MAAEPPEHFSQNLEYKCYRLLSANYQIKVFKQKNTKAEFMIYCFKYYN